MPTNDNKTSTRSLYYNTEDYPSCVNDPHRSIDMKFDHRTDIYSRNLTNNTSILKKEDEHGQQLEALSVTYNNFKENRE
jgi:hypothetical protein